MSSPVATPPDAPSSKWAAAAADEARDTSGAGSSAENSQPGSAGRGRPAEKKKRVGFTGGDGSGGGGSRERSRERSRSASPGPTTSPSPPTTTSAAREQHRSHIVPALSPQQTLEIHQAFEQAVPETPRPRPVIRRPGSSHAVLAEEDVEGPDETGQRALRQARAREALERGKRLEEEQKSAPNSRHPSPERRWGPSEKHAYDDEDEEAIALDDLGGPGYDTAETTEDDEAGPEMPSLERARRLHHAEAHRLVRKHAHGRGLFHHDNESTGSGGRSGVTTPTDEQQYAHDYRPRPEQFRGGVLGALLKLYNQPHGGEGASSSTASLLRHHRRHTSSGGEMDSAASTPQHSPPTSGTATPTTGGGSPGKRWLGKHKNASTSSLAQLIGTSASLGSPVVSGLGEEVSRRMREQQEQQRRAKQQQRRGAAAMAALNRVSRPRLDEEIRVTVHIAETIARQRYLMRLCRALMTYGAPTHRLEEYMKMSARVLEVDAQFLYIPGSMIISFDDAATHTTEVKLVRAAQGLDLGKLRDVHEVYKEVVHDRIGVEEAARRLKACMARGAKFSVWFRIPIFGLAAVCVGPFAFSARLIDLPIAFVLGCILGVLQLVVAPRSDLYANVFEISASVITSFLARAFGSIPYHGGRLFCFSALAQASIALILPGYIVLCASLELQSRSIVAGSVRMVYAIIYSLFLGFGITVGVSIYGLLDSNATSETTCSNPLPGEWAFFFVPGFALCLAIVNQAKWKQTPAMVVIAFGGYVVNYYSSQRFQGNSQISSTLGALAIGVMANLHSRVGGRVENWALDQWEDSGLRRRWKGLEERMSRSNRRRPGRTPKTPKTLEEGGSGGGGDRNGESAPERGIRRVGYGLAAAAMLPAIFVQVPSGLSVSGSLVAGIATANQLIGNATNGTTTVNTTTLTGDSTQLNSIAFNVGYSVIQVALGITVGLFLSAVVVYPFGKKRSGLFSF